MSKSNLKSLRLLEKFQKTNLNNLKRELAQYVADEASLKGEIRDIEEKIDKNQGIMTSDEAANNLIMLNGYRHWLAIVKTKRDQAKLKLEDIKQRSEKSRLKVIAAAKDLNATQSLIKASEQRMAYDKARFEQYELDEQAQFSKLAKPNFHNYKS